MNFICVNSPPGATLFVISSPLLQQLRGVSSVLRKASQNSLFQGPSLCQAQKAEPPVFKTIYGLLGGSN